MSLVRSLVAHNTAVLDAVLPVIEKLTFVFSLRLQSGMNSFVSIRVAGLVVQGSPAWNACAEHSAIECDGHIASYSPLALTARFRLGSKSERFLSRCRR